MSVQAWWWAAAGAGVALELASGTFYLLMLSLGLGAAGLVALWGGGTAAQWVTAGVVGGGAVTAWHLLRPRPSQVPVAQNRNVHLDVGQRVHVAHWNADATARVSYSGAHWDARFHGTGQPQPGDFVIHAVEGSTLVLMPLPQPPASHAAAR